MNEQRSDAWFKEREKRITGSQVGGLLGLSPFITEKKALEVLKNPPSKEEREANDNNIFAYGREVEEHAIAMFEMEFDIKVEETGFHTHKNWLGASPDGLIGDDAVAEIKCPWSLRNEDDPQFKSAEEQMHYYAQMQIEMFVTDTSLCYFYQYANGHGKLEIVERSDAWLDKYIPILHKIWLENIGGEVNPSQEIIDDYFYHEAQVKHHQSMKAELLQKIIGIAGNESGIVGDAVLKKSERQGAVKYAQVVKDFMPDVDLEAYRGEAKTVWSLKR